MTTTKEDRDLARKVARRKALVEKFIEFAEDITQRRGRETDRRQGSSHTNVTRELRDFGGFSFFTDGTHTMMGGHSVKIARNKPSGPEVVFEIYYQSSGDIPEVKVFSNERSWQSALARVIRDEEKIAEKIKANAKIEADRRTAERAHQAQQNELRKTAERLKV